MMGLAFDGAEPLVCSLVAVRACIHQPVLQTAVAAVQLLRDNNLKTCSLRFIIVINDRIIAKAVSCDVYH